MQICSPRPSSGNQQPKILDERWRIKKRHDENCSCCCCIPSPICYKYVQPEVPKSCAPIRRYWKSTIPMDDNTTYQLSYWENPSSKVEPILPRDCLVTGNSEMSDQTTYNTSYMDYLCVKPVSSITPCEKQLLGRGPMQDVTTQKHDYTWKSIETTPAYKARNNIYCNPAPLLDDTTYKLSYYESCCNSPPESFAPVRRYVKSDIPFEDNTTYRLSYWPNMNPMKEKSWRKKQEYTPPTYPIDGCTTYKLSYYPNCQERPSPILPRLTENILNAQCCNDKNTIYRLSYFGCEDGRRDPIIPPGNITFSTCPPAYDTVHRMSFVGNWNVKPVEPITPCSKQMLGRGQIQDVTTQKHDFTWKQIQMEPGSRPKDNLVPPCGPIECCTTHRMSYLPSDCESLRPIQSYAPIRVYKPSDIPMNGETVMHLSYQPVETGPVQRIRDKNDYHPPDFPIDGHTTYNTSYIPPGTLEPCCMETKPCLPSTQCCC
nr:uncharacterized protein LOC117608487 isoform X2 [Osmia lignaria]